MRSQDKEARAAARTYSFAAVSPLAMRVRVAIAKTDRGDTAATPIGQRKSEIKIDKKSGDIPQS
jgi:hypothetical protein